MTLTTIVVVIVAAAAALAYNRRVWRPRQARTRQLFGGLGSNEVTRPLAALAVLLLVFVLIQTFGSWAAAGRAETDEATATLLLFRETDIARSARPTGFVRGQMAGEIRGPLPCDDAGLPLRAPGFRPGTDPVG